MTNKEYINKSRTIKAQNCHEYCDILVGLTKEVSNIDYPSLTDDDYPAVLQVIVTRPADNPFGARMIVSLVDLKEEEKEAPVKLDTMCPEKGQRPEGNSNTKEVRLSPR